MVDRGWFVTLEAVDGAGKSTQIPRIEAWVRALGREVVVTREPGGTELAEKLRSMALSMPMDGLTEAMLMFAARRDHIKRVIEPALARGAVVVCDRFTDSSFAYQGWGRGFPVEQLQTLEEWVQEGLQPDLTLWFDLEANEAARRRQSAREADRFEQEQVAFFERVIEGYRSRMQASNGRMVRVDASADKEGVWDQVKDVLDASFGQLGCV